MGALILTNIMVPYSLYNSSIWYLKMKLVIILAPIVGWVERGLERATAFVS